MAETKTEVVKVMVSEDKASAIEESIRKSQFAMAVAINNNIMDIALKVTECVEQKVHVLRGYEDNMKGAEKYLMDSFGIRNTQRKSYAIVTHKYAKRVEGSSEYVLLDPRFRDFGIANLEEIQKLPDFDNTSAVNLIAFLDKNNITSDTTKTELQKLRGIEDKSTKKKSENNADDNAAGQPATEPVAEDNFITQMKAENDQLHAKVEDTKTDFAKLYQLALDKKLKDADFRKQAIEILKKLEKKYQ